MAEIKYEIVQEICVLSESARGWTKELNLVSWNDREPKFDIRCLLYTSLLPKLMSGEIDVSDIQL